MNAPTLNLARFNTAEFERMARTGAFGSRRVELRRGLIVEMNAEHMAHGRVKHRLGLALQSALERAQSTLSLWTEGSVSFGGDFEPMPDMIIWDEATVTDLQRPIPGDLVKLIVEVSDSTLPDDVGGKLAEYAAAGLAEYWVADVKNRRIIRHAEPVGDTYALREITPFGETITALTFPLTVDTAALA
ncbi:MAG: Uma2 family endonuclease [Alphaproteobacteria bacterium]|nr:Uma2 family endonuclease [Alphaproteobacteria bacterium]